MMKYKVMEIYYDEPVLETNDLKEVIRFIKKKEKKDYHKYLDYYQKCIDNYDVDFERPADFYASYFVIVDDEFYDITNINVLERKMKDGFMDKKSR